MRRAVYSAWRHGMPLPQGHRLGPFEILAFVGQGGMGEVYRARDTRLDRTVALKLLASDRLESPRALDRFRQEARAIARLAHPHICALHDVSEHDGTTFLVMEYLDGVTLARRLENGPLPLDLALRYATQIADALDRAHREGVVHRDLKPGNIMLTRDGAKLVDFGLAKLKLDADEPPSGAATRTVHLTEQRAIVGTPAYMAPEQIDGRQVDARTDLFAFGVVLYEMVAGRRPFVADSSGSLMGAILTSEPPALASLQPAAPSALGRVVTRCLAKDPDDRWQTARDLAAELRWVAEGGAGPAAAVTPPSRRWRDVLIGAITAAVLTALVLVAVIPLTRSTSSTADYFQLTFRYGVVSSARFTPDGQSLVYTASWEGRPYNLFLGQPGNADARSLELENGRIMSISRAGEMAVLFGRQSITHGVGPRTLARVPLAGGTRRDLLEGVVDADWIPGTDDLAVIRQGDRGAPWVVEFPVGTKIHEAPAAWSLRVSPDGDRVAFFEGPRFFGAEPEASVTTIDRTGRKTTVARNRTGLGLAWAPSGAEIWFTATRGQRPPSLQAASLSGAERAIQSAPDWLVLLDIARDGRVLLTRNTIKITMSCQSAGEPAERDLGWLLGSVLSDLSSDGRTLVFAEILGVNPSGEPTVFIRPTDGSPAVRLGEGYPRSLSPDGKWVLAQSKRAWVLLPAGAGSMVTLPKGRLARMDDGAWLRDGEHITFTGTENEAGGRPRVYVQDIRGGDPRAISPEGVSLARSPATPDGRHLLGRAGDAWQLYPIDKGQPLPIPALTSTERPVQWSPDGRFVYTVTPAGSSAPAATITRVEIATGKRVLWKTPGPSDPVGVDYMENVALTPDGSSYCYSFVRRYGHLFLVEGLK